MALSAVSSGAYAVGLVVGKAALPIAVDLIANFALKRFTKQPTNTRMAIAALPACAALYLTSSKSGFEASDILACGCYAVVKVVIRLMESRRQPPLEVQYQQFMEKMSFVFDSPLDYTTPAGIAAVDAFALRQHAAVREKWKDPAIIAEADKLIRAAEYAMFVLYDDLERAVAGESDNKIERNIAMANLLTRRQDPNDYYSRFCKEGSITLLDIYRTLRGLSFSVRDPHQKQTVTYSIINDYNRNNLMQRDEDINPFFAPNTPQQTWRTIYNDMIKRFEPICRVMDITKTAGTSLWI
ncbi:MAG TPA: hypothetical protein VLH77_01190, partial [Gammaproteobacteria bacterium]|nr:hypothetical protein [Gammaproteobacteria bacterium]